MGTQNVVGSPTSKRAFVVMPFSATVTEKNWTEVFETVFRPALEEAGFTCERAETSTGNLIVSVVQSLVQADLVIVDVTDRNANVFYELGVRHSLRRGTIIVSRGTEHVPSDLKGYWYLNYGLRPQEVIDFKRDIKKLAAKIQENPNKSDNPVSDYLDRQNLSSSEQVNRDNLKKLGALLTELSGNQLAVQRQLTSGEAQILSLGSLYLLIQTLYIDPGPTILQACHELAYKLELLGREKWKRSVAVAAISETEALRKQIAEIRQHVARGDFAEPTTVSLMIWSTIPTSPPPASDPTAAGDDAASRPSSEEESAYYSQLTSYEGSYSYAGPSCTTCSDTGSVTCSVCGGNGQPCTACDGSGETSCLLCNTGRK